MSARVACVVPFCRRTMAKRQPWHTECLCATHYPLVDRSLKALRRRAARAGKGRLEVLIWARMRRQAIERAAGI